MKNLLPKQLSALIIALPALLFTASLMAAELPSTPAPEQAQVYFIGLQDGDQVQSPLTLHFGLSGMGIAPAGVQHPNTGHHHLLINVDEATLPAMDRPLPATEQIIHFGGGQTETTIELEPGEYQLQLILGDYLHIPHSPPVVSEPITITVK